MQCNNWPRKSPDCDNEPVVKIETTFSEDNRSEIFLCQDCHDRRLAHTVQEKVMEISAMMPEADEDAKPLPLRREIFSIVIGGDCYVMRKHFSLLVREWRDRGFPNYLLPLYNDTVHSNLQQAVSLAFEDIDKDRKIYEAIKQDVLRRKLAKHNTETITE